MKALNYSAATNKSSLSAFNDSITASSDGVALVKTGDGSSQSNASVTINNVIIPKIGNQRGYICTGYIPVRSGDVIAANSSNGASITFIPYV